MFEKVYELPISIDYVRHWGMAEAVREIIQNALDSESPFEWEIKKDTLLIRSKYAKLEPKSLLLGTTSKADNKDAIGSFGEGYKIALLVLTRLNYKVIIYNNDTIWTPEFRMSKKFNDSTLCVVESDNYEHKEGVTFQVSGLTEDDIEQIKESCLYMQKSIGAVKHTSKGLILMDKPNMLYIGGLFICKTSLEFGYDIKPEFIKLERDRQTVATFELKWTVKDMWFEVDDYEMIVDLMEKNCTDLEHVNYDTPEVIKEACYKHFQENNQDAIIAGSQAELESLIKKGMEKVIFVGSSIYRKSIESSSGYQTRKTEAKKALSISYDLEQWLQANKKHMRRKAIVNFQELIKVSIHWKKGND